MKTHGGKDGWGTNNEELEEWAQTEGGKKGGEPGSVVTYLFVILQVVVFGV